MSFKIACVTVTAAVLFVVCTSKNQVSQDTSKKLIVAVVGDGVPGELMCSPRETPLNTAQGRAMWDGADLAFRLSPRLDTARKYIEVRGYDDCGRADSAIALAKRLKEDLSVVAVIGHAASGTTRSAASIYSEAGIPLVMPIATSASAPIPIGSTVSQKHRLSNCLRLPPNDDRAQAPAVAYLVKEKLMARRCYLIRDSTENAAEYSVPLCNALRNILHDKIYREFDIWGGRKPNLQDIRDLFLTLDRDSIDVIVFVGYGSTALRLLETLRRERSSATLHYGFPKIVLTDGCMIDDLDMSGFDAYLTFPVPDIDSFPRTGEDYRLLKEMLDGKTTFSYEMFGYDAMLFVGDAVASCANGSITRDCLRNKIMAPGSFTGSCFAYEFSQGENTAANYYVYVPDTLSIKKPKISLKWVLRSEVYNYRSFGQ